ncbi:DUF3576 domain-containing protein [Sedimentitalea arenosa]|jgi:hypothetical protein|uniref:DUF3576 domain-containing protein n=1 Tax=Sedimentitalea arenosa TaxID=2798803 RepID=A0A8J7LSI1_9RHOB|nr:DUF3576 domain-containing protein [Arenibacterium arenosum]MBJ6372883.1 DUF3576 domain-containing protein [Arenibacterium arenosum]
MTLHMALRVTLAAATCLALTACGSGRSTTGAGVDSPPASSFESQNRDTAGFTSAGGSTIWDIFGPSTIDQTVNVNRYLWAASLEVLSFLPVTTVDPFTGVIITDYGTPPGGGRSYRATVHIKDPALDARSLKLALQTRGGPVSAATTRAVEDAILSRARQLRVQDSRI